VKRIFKKLHMYEFFLQHNLEKSNRFSADLSSIDTRDSKLNALFSECGGISIDHGLYRVHSYRSSMRWSNILNKFFPVYKGKIAPFGYDWLGRQYGIIFSVDNVIAIFDPSTVESFQLAGNLLDFHNKDLVFAKDETVSAEAFHSFSHKIAIKNLGYDQCVGYNIPLLLGGKDEFGNLEITNMEVYWQLQGQIFLQIKNLPPGTKISEIKFKPKPGEG
jgi:Domain of unknown function (DUF1851)